MITLTIRDLKSKKTDIKVFGSLDKARDSLRGLITNPEAIKGLTKGKYLESYSYDEPEERALIERSFPPDRKMDSLKNGN